MNHLTDPTKSFQLTLNTFIQARVRAVNYLGAGDWSELNTDQTYPEVAFVKTVPNDPVEAPYRNPDTATLTYDTISMIMPEIEDNSADAGGSTITSYQLEWMRPTDTEFQDLIGSSGDNLNRLITPSTTPGQAYTFRYRVSNVFGWSAGYSSQVTVLSATPPDTPATATTEITGSYVKIDWAKPADNYSTITAYEVTVKDTNGAQQVDLVSCDGADAVIREATECLVPLTTLIGPTFLLKQGDLVEVAISAQNAIGTSASSALNTVGALVETRP